MQDALGQVSRLTSLLQQFPDLNRMSDTALDEFLAKSNLQEYEKQELKSTHNKLEYYQERVFWHNLNEAEQSFFDFHNYIVRNKIFLSLDLQERFSKIDEIMWSAIIDREGGHQSKDHQMWVRAYKQIKDEVDPIKNEIEQLIQKRLHYYDAF